LTREALASYDAEWLSRNVANWIEQGLLIPDLVGNPISPRPWLTFEDRVTIHLGDGVDVEMIHTGGHTSDESMVYLPAQRVVFGGDNIFHKRKAFTGHGDLLAWISALEDVKRLPIDVVVPGHGPVGGADVIDAQLDDLRERWQGFIRGGD
jgi:glyoxylase-like metal-dependent hydrolase (beta-lactamase superfamily II)